MPLKFEFTFLLTSVTGRKQQSRQQFYKGCDSRTNARLISVKSATVDIVRSDVMKWYSRRKIEFFLNIGVCHVLIMRKKLQAEMKEKKC